jgi:hypothetical protein
MTSDLLLRIQNGWKNSFSKLKRTTFGGNLAVFKEAFRVRDCLHYLFRIQLYCFVY